MSGIAYGLTGDGVKQAFLEAETSVNTYAPPDLIKHSPGVAKFYESYDQSSGTPNSVASYNSDGVSDNAVGDTTSTITIDFSSANWAAVTSAGSGYHFRNTASRAAGSIRYLSSTDDSSAEDANRVSVVGFGVQL